MGISKEIIMIQPNQVLKHKHDERYILIIAVNKFKNIKTNTEEAFCTYYWSEYGLVGTDLLENIERDYVLNETNKGNNGKI